MNLNGGGSPWGRGSFSRILGNARSAETLNGDFVTNPLFRGLGLGGIRRGLLSRCVVFALQRGHVVIIIVTVVVVTSHGTHAAEGIEAGAGAQLGEVDAAKVTTGCWTLAV